VSPMITCVKKGYMEDSNTSTVFTAELQSIRLALTMALEGWDKGNRRQKAVIYTDDQAAIRTANNPSRISKAYIAADIVHLIDPLQTNRQIQLETKWVPAHTGITGNELADMAVKEAAGWRPSEPMCAGNRADQPRRLYPLRTTLGTWIKREAQRE
jgi:ribonuclease HI